VISTVPYYQSATSHCRLCQFFYTIINDMPTQQRRTSAEMPPLTRRLSLEETHQLAGLARRKSNDRMVREDLRLKLAHTNVLDNLLKDIAKRSPPPSPTQTCVKMDRKPTIQWAPQIVSKVETVDELGFAYDDGAEDLEELSLTRTVTRVAR
jgi:hypothetical protein